MPHDGDSTIICADVYKQDRDDGHEPILLLQQAGMQAKACAMRQVCVLLINARSGAGTKLHLS
jgi:hypothetical protein